MANVQDALSQLKTRYVFAVVAEDGAPEFFSEKTIREIATQSLSERMSQRLGYDFGMCVLDIPFDLDELVSIPDDFLASESTALKLIRVHRTLERQRQFSDQLNVGVSPNPMANPSRSIPGLNKRAFADSV